MDRQYGPASRPNAEWHYLRTRPGESYARSFAINIADVQAVLEGNGTRIYVLAAGKDEGNGCHACPGLIGAFILESQGGQYRLVAHSESIEFGSWGSVSGGLPDPYFSFQQFGPHYYGWVLWQSYTAQGEASSVYDLLTQSKAGNSMEIVGTIPRSLDRTGTFQCEPSNQTSAIFCGTLTYDLAFSPLRDATPLYPISIKEKEYGRAGLKRSTTFEIDFDEQKWKYPLPFKMPWERP